MKVAGSIQDNVQLETVGPEFRLDRGAKIPAFGGEVATGGEQSLMDAFARQMQWGHLGGDRSAKVHHLQSFLNMQFTGAPAIIHAVVIVNTIGQVRILLHLAQNHAWTNGVRRTGPDKESVACGYRVGLKDILKAIRAHCFQELLLAYSFFQTE